MVASESKNTLASGGLFGFDANVEDGQMRIAIVAVTMYGEDRGELVTGEVANGFGALRAAPRFIGSQTADALMNTFAIVPVAEVVEATLDEREVERPLTARDMLPEFECSEKPFALSVELWPFDGAVNDADAKGAKQVGKGFTELRTTVGDGESRRAELRHGQRKHFHHGFRGGRGRADLEREQPAREPIENGRYPEGHPEHVDLGEVGVPDVIEVRGFENVERFRDGLGLGRRFRRGFRSRRRGIIISSRAAIRRAANWAGG